MVKGPPRVDTRKGIEWRGPLATKEALLIAVRQLYIAGYRCKRDMADSWAAELVDSALALDLSFPEAYAFCRDAIFLDRLATLCSLLESIDTGGAE